MRGNRTVGSAPARGTGDSDVTGFGAGTLEDEDGVCRVVGFLAVVAVVAVVRPAVTVVALVDGRAVVLVDVDVVVDEGLPGVVDEGLPGVVATGAPVAGGEPGDDAGAPPHPATRVTVSATTGAAHRWRGLIGAPLCPFRPNRTTRRPRWWGQLSLQGRETVGTTSLGRSGSGGTSASGTSSV
ncbi:hypothetical protein GCM10009867_18060 [Pedococcus aerophilus]|uniref:Uncharacterized protein n=1 Tax=Pedococcus aerophilus TaxID=436356 RepID=A0ABN3UMH4_9MICO